MRWLELCAQADSGQAELVVEVLGRFGYGGVAIEEGAAWAQDEGTFPTQKRQVTVEIFLPIDNFLPVKRSELEEALTSLTLSSRIEMLQCEIDEQQWQMLGCNTIGP